VKRSAALPFALLVLLVAVAWLVFGGNQIHQPIGPLVTPAPSALSVSMPSQLHW
jgi:hypothetical protein